MSETKLITSRLSLKELQEKLGLKNIETAPRIKAVVVNVGVGRIVEKENRQKVAELIGRITNQKPIPTKARKSVAAFKIREGNTVGYKVTLRGNKMYHFIDKLVHVALPRTRDFRGVSKSSVSDAGISIGIKDISIFPAIRPDELKENQGAQVNIVISNSDRATTEKVAQLIGLPLEKENG